MNKRKRQEAQFEECIDPRFNGIFQSTKTRENTTQFEDISNDRYKKNNGFQRFIRTKLFDYLDKHIKEVDKPVIENDFFKQKLESIRLFSDSELITDFEPVELNVQRKPKKKKKKKERCEKELTEDVVLSYEQIQRQAQILNS